MSEEFDPDKFIEDNKHLLVENQPDSQESASDDDKFADDFIARNIQYLQLDDERTPFQKAKDWLEPKLRGAAQGALFGFPDEITARAESIFTDKPYEQALRESRANYKAAQERDPWGYGASELGGAILSPVNKVAMPISALKKAMDIKKYAGLAKMAQAAINGSIQGGIAGYGYGDDIKDVGTGALVSGTLSSISPAVRTAVDVPAVGNAVKKVGEYAGKALQGPEAVLDRFSLQLGKLINSIPGIDVIKNSAPSIFSSEKSSSQTSAMAEHYKEVIRGVSKYAKIKEELGDIAYRKFGDLKEDERQKVFEAMKKTLEARGRDAYSPSVDRIQKAITEQLRADPIKGEQYVGDMVTGVIKEQVASGAERMVGQIRVNINPEVADEFQLKLQHMLEQGLKDIDDGIRDKNFYTIKGNENAFKRRGDFGDFYLELMDKERIKPSEFNPYSKKGVDIKVKDAQKMLHDLSVGKNVLSVAGLGTDAIGSLLGKSTSTSNILGAIPLATQVMGGLGRGLEKASREIRPEQLADSFLANPSILQWLSKKEGKLGIMAGNVLRELQEKGIEGAKSKLFLLAIDPDFRRLFAVNEKTGQTNTTNSNPQNQERNKPWVDAGTP